MICASCTKNDHNRCVSLKCGCQHSMTVAASDARSVLKQPERRRYPMLRNIEKTARMLCRLHPCEHVGIGGRWKASY